MLLVRHWISLAPGGTFTELRQGDVDAGDDLKDVGYTLRTLNMLRADLQKHEQDSYIKRSERQTTTPSCINIYVLSVKPFQVWVK